MRDWNHPNDRYWVMPFNYGSMPVSLQLWQYFSKQSIMLYVTLKLPGLSLSLLHGYHLIFISIPFWGWPFSFGRARQLLLKAAILQLAAACCIPLLQPGRTCNVFLSSSWENGTFPQVLPLKQSKCWRWLEPAKNGQGGFVSGFLEQLQNGWF